MNLTLTVLDEIIEKIAPKSLALDWDNTGYNIKMHDDINAILTCVDITCDIIDEAIEMGADTIVSHHPLIFHPIKHIDSSMPVGGLIIKLIQHGINVYCAHTSFDSVKDGMNYVIAENFGVCNAEALDGIGTIGKLAENYTPHEFALKTKEVFNIPALKCSKYSGEISTAAFLGGSGGDYIYAAKKKGADVLVTGEAKHNEFLEAEQLGIMLIAAGHFDTEHCFTHSMAKGLQKYISELQYNTRVYESKKEKCPYQFV